MRRFTPLFGAKVEHIVEKHSDVSGGHCGGTGGHIFGFRGRHGDGGRHGRIGFDEGAVVENHVSDGGAASVRAILPTGVGEDGEIGIWDAMVKADVVDWVGSTIGIEFESVVGAAAKVANEPGESSEINYARGDACFSKFANSKKDVGACVVGEIEKGTHGGAEGKALLLLFDESNVGGGYGAVILAEGVVGRKGSIAFGEFGIRIITLESIQNVAVLIQSIA